MKNKRMGPYLIEANAVYWADKARWQPVLRISRPDAVGDEPLQQDFKQLAAVFHSEADAIDYGMAKGTFLVDGIVIGLLI